MGKKVDIPFEKFMQDEDLWPMWPILPVKKRTGSFPTLGCILAGQGPRVYLKDLYSNVPWNKAETITYVSFAELVDDGWVVD